MIAGIAEILPRNTVRSQHMEIDPENPKPQSSSPVSHSRVLRLKEVCKVTGLGRSFIYQLQAEDQFPHSIKIGVRAVGWLEREVQEWVERRIQLSRSNFG
jgi:prophage regulatory protein